MLYQSKVNDVTADRIMLAGAGNSETATSFPSVNVFSSVFEQYGFSNLDELMVKLGGHTGKRSFLVFKNNKYINILTENIAFFYVRYDSTIIVTFDKQEYFVNYSLEQVQNLLPGRQFFRINRQYLVSFNAITEAEHYFARKLLVNLAIPTKEKLIISKEKVTSFLQWLDNR